MTEVVSRSEFTCARCGHRARARLTSQVENVPNAEELGALRTARSFAIASCPGCGQLQPGAFAKLMKPLPDGFFLLPLVFAVVSMAIVPGGPAPRLTSAAVTYVVFLLAYGALTFVLAKRGAARIQYDAPNRFEPLLERLRAAGVAVQPPPPSLDALGPLPGELRSFLALTQGFSWGEHVSGDVSFLHTEPTRLRGLLRVGAGFALKLQPVGDDCRVWWEGQYERTCVLLANSLGEYVEQLTQLAEAKDSNRDGEKVLGAKHALTGASPNDLLRTAQPGLHPFLKSLPDDALVFDFHGAASHSGLEDDVEDVIVVHHEGLVALVPNRFAAALTTLAARDVLELQLAPPASDTALEALVRHLEAPLPAELAEFLALTTGFLGEGGSSRLKIELDAPVVRKHPRNQQSLLRIADFSEAGGLYAQVGAEPCATWWLDSTSETAVLVARSLLEYVERINETLEYEDALPDFAAPEVEPTDDEETESFASLVDRLRELEFEDCDEGDERIVIHPPADDAFKVALARRLRTPLVPELEEFLSVTRGLSHGGTVEHLEFDEHEGLDIDGMVPIYDFGNGDHAYLEQYEGACRVWWFGHDPFDCMLVARSLRELFTKIVCNAEAAAAGEEETELTFSPDSELDDSSSPAALLEHADDEATRAFLKQLPPDARVFDVEGHDLPVELSGAHGYLARHGELIAFT